MAYGINITKGYFMKKLFLLSIMIFSVSIIAEAKKKSPESYKSVENPVIVTDSGRQPIVFQKVINTKIKGDKLYDDLNNWALAKIQNTSKIDAGFTVFGGKAQQVKKGEILVNDKKNGKINFIYVSSFFYMGYQFFFTVMLEIKDDRFRVTTCATKVFDVQGGGEKTIEESTGKNKKWYKAYVEDYKKLIYDLEKVANGEYEPVSSDF